jgi:hypothetical protein
MINLSVPYITDRKIEQAATELLTRYAVYAGAPPSPPIPVENIVEGLLEVTLEVGDLRERLGMKDVLGATWLEDKYMMLDSTLDDQPGRFAFTLAHETGHWCLHRPLLEKAKGTIPLFPHVKGAKPTPAIVCRSGKKRARHELQADKFAACLLMPPAAVRASALAAFGRCPLAIAGLNARRQAKEPDDELWDAAETVVNAGNFANVSNTAMRLRLVELKLVVDGAQQVLL